jgi:flagellar basal-body rod protein FlgC
MPSPIDPTRRGALLPFQGEQVMRPMFRTLGIAASGLSAQRQRMETIAQNIANATVTRGADGTPYKRREVVMESATAENSPYPGPSLLSQLANAGGVGIGGGVAGTNGSSISNGDARQAIQVPFTPLAGSGAPGTGEFGVRIAGIAEDQGEGKLVYEPGHPDANANGFVRYPDIDTTQETVKLMDAKRMYEANASVFQTARSMLRAAIDI